MKEDSASAKNGLGRDFSWIVVAYIVAFVAALLAVQVSSGYIDKVAIDSSSLWRAAIADITATFVIFGFSRVFNNSSFYDAYWSVVPPILIGYWIVCHDALNLKTALILFIVLLWAIRLTHNWARGWQGLTHVDWRYVDLKQSTGAFYPLVELLGIQLLPTVLVFLGCMPVWIMVTSGSANPEWMVLQWWDATWVTIGLASVWLEFRADNVLRQHRSRWHWQGVANGCLELVSTPQLFGGNWVLVGIGIVGIRRYWIVDNIDWLSSHGDPFCVH